MRRAKRPPPFDRRRLTNGPQLRHEVTKVIGGHLRAVLRSNSGVDDVETYFTTAILQTTGRVAPPRECRLPGWGWMGDALAVLEAEIDMGMTARRAAWERQKADTQDKQLKTDVRRENTRVYRVCDRKDSLEDTSRIWMRICASGIRGGSSSASRP